MIYNRYQEKLNFCDHPKIIQIMKVFDHGILELCTYPVITIIDQKYFIVSITATIKVKYAS